LSEVISESSDKVGSEGAQDGARSMENKQSPIIAAGKQTNKSFRLA
jgi:hypothetical protein